MPAVPPLPSGNGSPGGPPLVWVGGTLGRIAAGKLTLREDSGPEVPVRRLAAGATVFYRVLGGRWEAVSEPEIATGQRACVQAVLDRATLLALRVFLGTDCRPG